MQPNEQHVLKLLEDAGLVTRAQIESAKSKRNGSGAIVDMIDVGALSQWIKNW